MKKTFLYVLALSVMVFFYALLKPKIKPAEIILRPQLRGKTISPGISPTAFPEITEPKTIAENLDTPWSIVFLPDKTILFTERPGRVRRISADGHLDPSPVYVFDDAVEIGEGGLLGMTIDPEFPKNNFVYFYYTYRGNNFATLNKVVKMIFKDGKLGDKKVLTDNIPGAPNHNGGRIKFGPDNYLYVTTGDAQNPSRAQDKQSVSGKILRMTVEGKPAPGNPFGNLVYSYGHRNPQGLAWDGTGQLFATEHGRSGLLSGLDEFNKIEPGKNYGWPVIQGDESKKDMIAPLFNSGADTWAPSGMAYVNGSFYFGGLRGQALYEIKNLSGVTSHFKEKFGRIRDVVLGPDNMLYITTSNNDSRGIPASDDDRIIEINPGRIND